MAPYPALPITAYNIAIINTRLSSEVIAIVIEYIIDEIINEFLEIDPSILYYIASGIKGSAQTTKMLNRKRFIFSHMTKPTSPAPPPP